ncbi:MAG: hypothetical protein AAFW73_10495 [Bacteroidota bacterium]
MAYLLVLVSSTLLYSKSKYFPRRWSAPRARSKQYRRPIRAIGFALLVLAAYRLVGEWGYFTGLMIWLNTVLLFFCSLVMLFPGLDWLRERLSNQNN